MVLTSLEFLKCVTLNRKFLLSSFADINVVKIIERERERERDFNLKTEGARRNNSAKMND